MNNDQNVVSDEMIENVRHLLNSKGWTEGYAPSIVALITDCMRSLLDPSKERVDNKPDDFIRGQIAAFHDVLALGHNSLREHDAAVEKMRETREQSEDYVQRAADGVIGPLSHDDYLAPN